MPPSTAWQCILAQTELAHLTNTLPPEDSYEGLTAVIESKLSSWKMRPPNIHEALGERGVVLSRVYDAPLEYNSSASCPGDRPPAVVFLCDMEGTTTPLPFVKQVMLPLAASYADTYTKVHFPSDAAFVQHVAAAAAFLAAKPVAVPTGEQPDGSPVARTLSEAYEKSEAAQFKDEDANNTVRQLFCHHLREEIKKEMAEAHVKAVVCSIWEEVYAQGQHQTQVFPDVNEFFRYVGSERNDGLWHIATYSCYSVAAQKVMLRYTPYGDLNPFITAYFDPSIVGTKLMQKSYMRIHNLLAQQLDIGAPEDLRIVFLTDSTSEASAADCSGAIDCPVLCMRPLNEWITTETMFSVPVPFITSFSQLLRPDEKVDYHQLVKYTLATLQEKAA
ncbi:hypothetical protein ABL78_0311 [Leptomonas seymouri]|uniref:Uncharacterized protein n=1 Tax=Leptomonas seymouri TaxID=5684 RepID=A0A0N1PEN0_LEPSE|nr:hypothetical protein ABL78_0311 [Leptomonas seymouri]|eukprot:KPI90551.1 hypothetical protein ABL78_0311 [Leptomonas seymouri]